MPVILFLKFLTFFLRTFTKNSGTALPGLILEKYFPKTLKKLFSQLNHVVLITGTNGKTTTSRMLCHLLKKNKVEFISNSSGSNMIRGMAAVLVQNASFLGDLKAKTAIFEVEEATMPRLVKFVKPDVIVVTNIFRDQLDAYGEIDKTYKYIREAVENSKFEILNSKNHPVLRTPLLLKEGNKRGGYRNSKLVTPNSSLNIPLSPFKGGIFHSSAKPHVTRYSQLVTQPRGPVLVLNKDDSRVRKLGQFTENEVSYVGLSKEYLESIRFEDDNESSENFQLSKDSEVLEIENIRVDNDLSNTFDVKSGNQNILKDYKILIPGVHSTFNSIAALSAFRQMMRVTWQDLISKYDTGLDDFQPVFGRGEVIKYKNTNFQIFLVKNPAGMDLNLRLLENVKDRSAILFILNDNIADGRDVSWIWDCDFSLLKNLEFKNIFVAGSRRWDMALRIRYEIDSVNALTGLRVKELVTNSTQIFETISEAIQELSKMDFERVYVLPTYTAMLEFRRELAEVTEVSAISN